MTEEKPSSQVNGIQKDGSPAPIKALEAVLLNSISMPQDAIKIQGYDFNDGLNYENLIQSYFTTGYQATNLGKAIEEINKMVKKHLIDRIFH